MTNELLKLYHQFRKDPPFMLVGRNAEMALDSARTVLRFRELEAEGLVRISAVDEDESYFSAFGEPDDPKERRAIEESIETYGCYYVFTEYLDERGDWQHADGVGMCAGYKNPTSEFENCYVVGMMGEAVRKAENEHQDRLAFEAEVTAAAEELASVE